MKSSKRERGGGGYCCEHCSDSKFPCIFMERQMKGEPRRRRAAEDNAEESAKKEA